MHTIHNTENLCRENIHALISIWVCNVIQHHIRVFLKLNLQVMAMDDIF